MQRTSKIGKRYGQLIVLARLEKTVNGRDYFYQCRCDCGEQKQIRGSNLHSGNTVSCGCFGKKQRAARAGKMSAANVKYGDDTNKNSIFTNYIARAKRHEIAFELTFNDFIEIVTKNCYYCDEGLSSKSTKNKRKPPFYYTGIDRVSSFEGYTKTNSVPCCKYCNRAKSDQSLPEFLKRVGKIARRFGYS